MKLFAICFALFCFACEAPAPAPDAAAPIDAMVTIDAGGVDALSSAWTCDVVEACADGTMRHDRPSGCGEQPACVARCGGEPVCSCEARGICTP